jgi:hypothetical protein
MKRKRLNRKNPQAVSMAKRRARILGPKRCREIAAMGGRAKAEKARLAREGRDEVTTDKRPVARRRARHL